jgi:hypothetical protein
MTTTYFASVNDGDVYSKDVEHAGTSSTAADVIEVRMGNGTTVPTQRQVINGLNRIMRWILQGGLDGAGANLPPSRG